MVRYDGEKFPLYLNVGKGLNDRKYHIYDITKTIRDTANRINGFERPNQMRATLRKTVSPIILKQVNKQQKSG